MSKFKFDLDEYDDDFDDVFNNNDVDTDTNIISEENDYSKFNQIIEEDSDLDVEEIEYDEAENTKKNINIINKDNDNVLSIVYKWFSRIGVFIAIVLIALFITNGDISSLLKYILLLVFSFGLGYIAMFLYDKYKEIS